MRESGDPEALPAFEQATASLWTVIDDFTILVAQYEVSHDDVPSRLKAMRRSYRSSLQLLRAFETTIGEFSQRIGRFESYISRTALNYGLNLLPDDVLSEIFVLATRTLEEKVALSLVCRRFRGVMMSVPKMWDGYWIESTQTPEQNIAIAEGKKFTSLKARIASSCDVPVQVNARVDHMIPYWKFSVGLILSFGPDELVLYIRYISDWEEIEPVLASANMQNLRSLAMSRNSVGAQLLEKWDMPLLQNLRVGFVPGAALARNLVQCSLYEIGEAEIDSLREFLAAANSLQNLCLFLSESRFYEVCDLPSLRSLEVNFVPHPSLARRLVQLRLSFPPWGSPAELLDFLSSSEALRELCIDRPLTLAGLGMIDVLPVVTMPSLVSCVIRDIGPSLTAKLRMPVLRTLKLSLSELRELSAIARDEFRASLQSMPSLEDLQLMGGDVALDDLDEIIRYAPPHLESFSVWQCRLLVADRPRSSTVPNRRLIHFENCGRSFSDFMPNFMDYLMGVGLGGMKIQFSDCRGWRDGTFGLDDVMTAVEVDQEGWYSTDSSSDI